MVPFAFRRHRIKVAPMNLCTKERGVEHVGVALPSARLPYRPHMFCRLPNDFVEDHPRQTHTSATTDVKRGDRLEISAS